MFHTAISFLRSTVKALAFLAVFNVAFGATAVASVPRASSYIIGVIAEPIALELRGPTSFLDLFDTVITFALVRTVQALALLAIVVVVCCPAAISSVPIASSVVVLIVAVLVASPFRLPATPLYGFRARIFLSFVRTVPALALLAIFEVVACPTTVPSIPVAAS